MGKYILKRILITIRCFWHGSPNVCPDPDGRQGTYLDTLRMDPQFSEETIARYEKLYQLNKPVLVQYVYWIKNLLRLELGYSFHYNVPVIKDHRRQDFQYVRPLVDELPLLLGDAPSLSVFWAAVHRNRFIDRLVQMLSYVFLSFPSFFVAMILLYWASQTNLLPLGGECSARILMI